VVAVVLTTGFTAGWEAWWRHRGIRPSVNNTPALWAIQRRALDHDPGRTLIIGSSRAAFDINLKTWAEATGEPEPLQLAIPGSNPVPVLTDLAEDPAVTGLVIVGITPGLFFSPLEAPPANQARQWVLAARRASPFVRFRQRLAILRESHLAFLSEPDLSARMFLRRLNVPDRPGTLAPPPPLPPISTIAANRQEIMLPRLERDSALQRRVREHWRALGAMTRMPPLPDPVLGDLIHTTALAVETIEQRGGRVVLVRFPSSGEFREAEAANVPRRRSWDRLLEATGAPGIHFEDVPELRDLVCPDWSHLGAADARRFTRVLVRRLRELDVIS